MSPAPDLPAITDTLVEPPPYEIAVTDARGRDRLILKHAATVIVLPEGVT